MRASREQTWRRLPPPHEGYDWAAVGEVAGLSVAVQVAGIAADALQLTVGVDPEPCLAGSDRPRAHPADDADLGRGGPGTAS